MSNSKGKPMFPSVDGFIGFIESQAPDRVIEHKGTATSAWGQCAVGAYVTSVSPDVSLTRFLRNLLEEDNNLYEFLNDSIPQTYGDLQSFVNGTYSYTEEKGEEYDG